MLGVGSWKLEVRGWMLDAGGWFGHEVFRLQLSVNHDCEGEAPAEPS